MKRIFRAIKLFFLPPVGTPMWLRLMPFIVMGILSIFVLAGGAYAWEYTNSPVFCGTSCHTMPPQNVTYIVSPHANVYCSECHIGRAFVGNQLARKAEDMRELYAQVFVTYHFPIRVTRSRPATLTCEKCHFPIKFSDDSLREFRTFSGEDNFQTSTFLLLKTGGGSKREGLGRGIHWHVENDVYFIATDSLQQDIPYVRVVNDDGTVDEYYDISSGWTPDDVTGKTLVKMDCVTCHNRSSHNFQDPVSAINQAINKQMIPRSLPNINAVATAALNHTYENMDAGYEAIAAIESYYQTNYPAVYREQREEILGTIATLNEIYANLVFPTQKVDWLTHPDNLGHENSPGCFRCHDGKHLSLTEEAIRLECNICHAIPSVVREEERLVNISLLQGPEPSSHTHTSWITLHGKAIDASCASCHPPSDPSVIYTELEGKPPLDDTTFCGNSACHGSAWTFTGFYAPELLPILERQLYILKNTSPYLLANAPQTYDAQFKAIFEGRCVFCHAGNDMKGNLDLSSYALALQGGSNGAGIVPGDPAASLVYLRQTETQAHFGQMTADEVEALQKWILNGAPEK